MIRLVALAALLMVAGASASYADMAGDAAPAFDAVALSWREGSEATVTLELESPPDDDGGYTAILFQGTVGTAEPTAWTIIHTGPGGDIVQYGHAPNQHPTGNVTRSDGGIEFAFSAPAAGDCVFAVARTVTYETGGQEVQDVIGWRSEDIGAAWDNGRACSEGQPVDAVIDHGEQTAVPGPAILVVLAGVFLLRRTQR